MNKKDTVVFDLDGTLLDTLEDLKNSVNYAMTQCGYPLQMKCEDMQEMGFFC